MCCFCEKKTPSTNFEGVFSLFKSLFRRGKALLDLAENKAWTQPIDYISIDHDAGIYAAAGGDFINVLNFLEYRQHVHGGKVYPIEIHSMNAVGCTNMKAICEKNNWTIIPN